MRKYLASILIGCVVLIVAGCAKGPTASYVDILSKANKKDWAGVYDSFSVKSQGKVDVWMRIVASLNDTEKLKGIDKQDGKALYVKLCEMGTTAAPVEMGEIVKEEINGDNATLTIATKKGMRKIVMIKENGSWRFVPDTDPNTSGKTEASSMSEKKTCINYLRHIEMGKEKWAMEQNKPTGATFVADDIKPYMKINFNEAVCPSGGKYTLNTVGSNASCSIHGDDL